MFLFIIIYGCVEQDIKNSSNYIIKSATLTEVDGPYIYRNNDSLSVVTVEKGNDLEYYIKKRSLQKNLKYSFISEVVNADNDSFSFTLMKNYRIPDAVYESDEKVLVTSDIEGNFNAFYSLLVGNNVMDEEFNWVFGRGHLVIVGDMMDRGNNVTPCLWLLYKLEKEANMLGGKVHYILGNHDVMNMHANTKYVKPKYLELAEILHQDSSEKEAYMDLFSDENELTKWIASKNTVEKIGNTLFVHGGISENIIDAGITIDEINDLVRKNIRLNLTNNPGEDGYANLIFSRKGPLWYRGLVKDYKDYYKKMSNDNLNAVLDYFQVERIVIGHTIVDKQVTSDFSGKVIRIGIKHASEKFSGTSQALLIENDMYYKVNDMGERQLIYETE